MARSYWRPTRWQRFTWWLEDWAPGESLSGYVEFLWHRLGCKLGWVSHQGDINARLGPVEELRRRNPGRVSKLAKSVVLVVPIDMSQPRGTWNPPWPPRGGNGQA